MSFVGCHSWEVLRVGAGPTQVTWNVGSALPIRVGVAVGEPVSVLGEKDQAHQSRILTHWYLHGCNGLQQCQARSTTRAPWHLVEEGCTR